MGCYNLCLFSNPNNSGLTNYISTIRERESMVNYNEINMVERQIMALNLYP